MVICLLESPLRAADVQLRPAPPGDRAAAAAASEEPAAAAGSGRAPGEQWPAADICWHDTLCVQQPAAAICNKSLRSSAQADQACRCLLIWAHYCLTCHVKSSLQPAEPRHDKLPAPQANLAAHLRAAAPQAEVVSSLQAPSAEQPQSCTSPQQGPAADLSPAEPHTSQLGVSQALQANVRGVYHLMAGCCQLSMACQLKARQSQACSLYKSWQSALSCTSSIL